MRVIFKALTVLSLCLVATTSLPSYAESTTSYQAPKIIAGTGVRVRANPQSNCGRSGQIALGYCVGYPSNAPLPKTRLAQKTIGIA